MPQVTDTSDNTKIDLQDVTTKNRAARDIVAGFSAAAPTLAEAWRHIEAALDDMQVLTAEITRLGTELGKARLGRANLAAAALAAIAAHREGESDPLLYLRDELGSQGYGPERGRR
jgi:hypothetical protein